MNDREGRWKALAGVYPLELLGSDAGARAVEKVLGRVEHGVFSRYTRPVNLWRIARARFQAMDGEGARLHGGRWNAEGLPVVYLSSSLSLAALEYLVHVDIEDAPSDLVAIEVEVPRGLREGRVLASELPSDWNLVADHPECVRRGDLWLEGRTAPLRVPSAVVPIETNVLLNPGHVDAGRVRVISHEPFVFDRRVLE